MSTIHSGGDVIDHFSTDAFIKLALDAQVLKFGDFLLKSGRKSPYFFDMGMFYKGKALREVGRFYANLLINKPIAIDHLFGPAYKGLPLATATAISLAAQGMDITVTFNRKELKTHGEGGQLIGAPLHGNTAIIDDVITAGTAFREAQAYITNNGGKLTTVIIALDRSEKGLGSTSTLEEIRHQGIEVLSIITFFDLLNYLHRHHLLEDFERLQKYQQEHVLNG